MTSKGMAQNEAKAKIQTYSVKAEVKISKCST